MKVGTDGVLLGVWSPLENKPESILDIGAGTGLIALILAQRSNSEIIDAIEIDEKAYEQCVDNFEASDWGDRLFCYHAGLDEFTEEIEDSYDLIVSNPPFYSEKVSSGDVSRDVARQNKSLPFNELVDAVSQLLSPNGLFTTIIPFKEEKQFVNLAKKSGLYCNTVTRVKGNLNSEIKRSLLGFSFTNQTLIENELIIELERHTYSEDYIELTKDFYLKM